MTRKHVILLAVLLASTALIGCRSAHVTSAILYLDEQMYQKAVDVLHEGLEYSPNEAEAYFYLGESHSKLAEEAVSANDYHEAKAQYALSYGYYKQTLDTDPNLAERVNTSLLYNYQLRSEEGTRQYRMARSADGERKFAYYEASEGQFRLAYAAFPDSISSIKNVARMKIQHSGEVTEIEQERELLLGALTLLDQALEANPEAYGLLSDKASVLSGLDRGDEANRIYDNLILEHPEDTGLLIDIANLAASEQQYKRAADLYVNVAELYESDENVANDEDMLGLYLQAARFYTQPSVLDFSAAIHSFDQAMDLEDIVQEDTLLQKLRAHYDYGTALKGEITPPDELPAAAREQFEFGVNTGIALVDSYYECAFGFYYLALCHYELGQQTEGDAAFQSYTTLNSQGTE